MSIIEELEKKRAIILGMGKEGLSTFLFLRNRSPLIELGCADKTPWSALDCNVRELMESDKNVKLFFGPEYLKNINDYEIIFKSPGIPPSIPELAAAEKAGKRISSNTNIFFEECPGTIVGVTGTKGKSTTASLICEVLKDGGYDARLNGNIGLPSLSSIEGATSSTVFVTELSSYQLTNLNSSPHIAVLLNIVREHIDYHQTFDAYINAKQTITRFQSKDDYLIFNASYKTPFEIAMKSSAKQISFGSEKTGYPGCFIENGYITFFSNGNHERIIATHDVPLKGTFNLQNVMPAIAIGKIFSISNESIVHAVKNFTPLEHRLEFAGTFRGVSFYNDSLATVPEATIAAIQTFYPKKIVLIAGGYDRGQDFTDLAKVILSCNVKAVILFPATGKRLWEDIVMNSKETDKLPASIFVTNMRDGVNKSFNFAKESDIVLLSPGSVSFGCFKDYADRGIKFKTEVKALIRSQNSFSSLF